MYCSQRATRLKAGEYVEHARVRPAKRKLCAVACIVLLAASCAFAVDPSKHITQYAHSAWRTREASFDGSPVVLMQTTDGYLWIGTNTGLIRFDGVRFSQWSPRTGQRLSIPKLCPCWALATGVCGSEPDSASLASRTET